MEKENGGINPYNIRFIFETDESINTKPENNGKIKESNSAENLCSNLANNTRGVRM